MSEEIKETNTSVGNYFKFDNLNNNPNVNSDYKLEISINSENKEKIQKIITNLQLTDYDIKITPNLTQHDNKSFTSTRKNNTTNTNKNFNNELDIEQNPLKNTFQQTESININKCISCEKNSEKYIDFDADKIEFCENDE